MHQAKKLIDYIARVLEQNRRDNLGLARSIPDGACDARTAEHAQVPAWIVAHAVKRSVRDVPNP